MKYLLWAAGAVALVILIGIIVKSPETIYNPNKEVEKTIYVASTTKTCESVTTTRCLQIKYNPEDAWQLFYGQIEGFVHENGTESTLRVREVSVSDAPKDANNVKYVLVETLDSKEVSYIAITSPVDGAKVATGKEITVTGTGRGLFENNVVVQFGTGGGMIGETITTMVTEEVGGEGVWEAKTTIEVGQDTPGTISAWSPSPKEGEDGLRFTTSVMYSVTDGQEISLEGTDWKLTKLMNNTNELIVPAGDITALFDNGSLSGSSGCNNYNTSYVLSEENMIQISEQIASTMMFCDGLAGSQESLFLSQLPKVKKYNINGITLILMSEKGETLLVYESESGI